ncbi:MAG TPA: zf-HC2 domain-containing protein [Pyrinomonadaceae bacterium]
MRCEECLPLLEEYADGESCARDAALVEAHLEACASCARARRELEEERALLLSYECDAAPAENFWDDVLSKIGAEASAASSSEHPSPTRTRTRLVAALGVFAAPRLSPALVAVLLVVAVGATVAVMKYATPREGASTSESAAASTPQKQDAPSASPSSNNGGAVASSDKAGSVDEGNAVKNEVSKREVVKSVRVKQAKGGAESGEARRGSAGSAHESAPDRLVREAEQKYLAAIRLLTHDVRRNRARLDAQTAARFERTLATIDRHIAGTRRAVRQHPGDPVAVNYMLAAYARKVEVLREMASY